MPRNCNVTRIEWATDAAQQPNATDPISNIVWVDGRKLDPNSWNPNIVHGPEFRLLEASLLRHGWIQPILVSRDGLIIDGFHRWKISMESAAVIARYNYRVPCVVMDMPQAEAMLLTVRINRAKGTHVGARMADLIKAVINEHGLSMEDVMAGIGATRQEIELLLQRDVFKQKDIEHWTYSKAWIVGDTRGIEGRTDDTLT